MSPHDFLPHIMSCKPGPSPSSREELWAKPLKMTLFTWLSTMSPQNLLRLKAPRDGAERTRRTREGENLINEPDIFHAHSMHGIHTPSYTSVQPPQSMNIFQSQWSLWLSLFCFFQSAPGGKGLKMRTKACVLLICTDLHCTRQQHCQWLHFALLPSAVLVMPLNIPSSGYYDILVM